VIKMLQGVKEVSVIGLGYVGLPTAAIIASKGLIVKGIDINEKIINTINSGKIHIIEPDLEAVVRVAVADKYLSASTQVQSADVFIITVPTPFKEDYQPDLSYVKAAAESIAPVLKKDNLIILESTSPVGATEQLTEWLIKARPDLSFPSKTKLEADIAICYCPERILPGRVLTELVENDRIIGGINSRCAEKAKHFYQQFVRGNCVLTDARTAELAKLTENAFRDVNVAFANELSLICDEHHINVWELINLVNHHPRVNVLKPGAGVGGHCIAVDPWFIVSASKHAKLIKTAREVNNYKPKYIVQKVFEAIKNPTNKIACLGLAYKPNIDDLRESPAVEIVHELATKLANTIVVIEPNVDSLPSELKNHKNIVFNNAIQEVLKEADVIVILVAHRDFIGLEPFLKNSQKVIDICGIINRAVKKD